MKGLLIFVSGSLRLQHKLYINFPTRSTPTLHIHSFLLALSLKNTFPDEVMSRIVSAFFMKFGVAFGKFSASIATKRKKAVVDRKMLLILCWVFFRFNRYVVIILQFKFIIAIFWTRHQVIREQCWTDPPLFSVSIFVEPLPNRNLQSKSADGSLVAYSSSDLSIFKKIISGSQGSRSCLEWRGQPCLLTLSTETLYIFPPADLTSDLFWSLILFSTLIQLFFFSSQFFV